MKQTAIEWFSNQSYQLFEQYSEGNFDRIMLNKLMVETTEKAKEMEKKQITDAYTMGTYQGRMDKSLTMDQYYNANLKKFNYAKK
jgi:hypothetical protein